MYRLLSVALMGRRIVAGAATVRIGRSPWKRSGRNLSHGRLRRLVSQRLGPLPRPYRHRRQGPDSWSRCVSECDARQDTVPAICVRPITSLPAAAPPRSWRSSTPMAIPMPRPTSPPYPRPVWPSGLHHGERMLHQIQSKRRAGQLSEVQSRLVPGNRSRPRHGQRHVPGLARSSWSRPRLPPTPISARR